MPKPTKNETEAARGYLRERIPSGTTVYTIQRHVSASGLTRFYDAYVFADKTPIRCTWKIADALGLTYDQAREAIRTSGDDFSIVYELAHVLHGDGYSLQQQRL